MPLAAAVQGVQELGLAAHLDGIQALVVHVEAQHDAAKGAAAQVLDGDVRAVDDGGRARLRRGEQQVQRSGTLHIWFEGHAGSVLHC
jgi:hypothetical protein